MFSFKGIRSTLILFLLLVACPLLAHALDEEAEKGRGGGGGRGGSKNRKPTKTVKIGKWNAPLWAVILIPIFVALGVYGWCHTCYKRCYKGKKNTREMSQSNLEAQNQPVTQQQTAQYPQFFVFELPPAAPYQTQGSYEKVASGGGGGGGEAEKFYTQQPALPNQPPTQPYNPYNPHGMGYPVPGQGYNNAAPVGYPMGGQR